MKLHVIDTGKFKLDGGAMFGVVPKQMWKKLNPPDENNMCTWAMRCLLLETDNRKILFDTGMGNKQDAKFMSYFEPHGDTDLLGSLAKKGFLPEDITDVFLTHLHFDHCGGAVAMDRNGRYYPQFPNAEYWSTKEHYEWALRPNDREKASFLKENFVPLMEHGVLKFIDAEQDIDWLEGIRVKFMFGHTEAMMIPVIPTGNGRSVVFMADLLPSTAHIRMPYVMSYDIRPLQTLVEKESFFREATDQGHLLFMEHDPLNELCSIRLDEKGNSGLDRIYSLEEII